MFNDRTLCYCSCGFQHEVRLFCFAPVHMLPRKKHLVLSFAEDLHAEAVQIFFTVQLGADMHVMFFSSMCLFIEWNYCRFYYDYGTFSRSEYHTSCHNRIYRVIGINDL